MNGPTSRPEERQELAAIVVRFERPIRELSVLRDPVLLDQGRIATLVVLDNSQRPVSRDEIARLPSWAHYKWLGGNVGLSRAYNAGIAMLEGSWTHVCFLDQDTDGLPTLFETLSRGITADITLPVVRAGNIVISPCRRVGPWIRPLRRPGSTPKGVSWINSGMTVARAALNSVRFDERLFLDYVDHRFARDVLDAGVTLDVRWGVTLTQDYSRSTDDLSKARTRFTIFQRDVQTFFATERFGFVWSGLLTLRRALSAAARYRDPAFVVAWLKGRRVVHD